MSAREGSSDTWPRYVPFPADNLDVAGAPEEDDVDHRGEAPSWLPGAGAVTGADPPDLDASDDEQHAGGPVYAAGPDDSDAPGFSDLPMNGAGEAGAGTSHGNGDGSAGGAPDFGDAAGPGFNGGQPEPSAFGDAPAFGGAPDGGYAPAHGADVFGSQGAVAFSGADELSQGYSGGQPQGFGDSPGYTDGQGYTETPGYTEGQRFGEGQQGPYVGPTTGEFRGDYESGYGATPSPDAGMAPADQGMGTLYRDQGYQGYQVGQENGARPMEQPTAYQSQYPPVEPPRSRMTASLRSKGRRFGSGRRNDQQGRQAQLTLGRIEPWSVMKFSFVISLVAFIVLFVAVAVLYAALSGLGVFSALQHSVSNITSSQGSTGFNLMTYLSASRVLGYTGLLGAINVVLITALCTVGSVLYNLTANLAGGVEITLKESD
jgi:Transmembrane domain of unknown function (DUF3566)